MQEISAWLHSYRDYASGMGLYSQYGKNEFLKNLFKSGPSDYNVKKLADELQRLASTSANTYVPECKTAAPLTITSIVADKPKEAAEYLKLLKKRDDIYRQIDRNMALLDTSKSKNILYETARQIIRLHQQKTEVWAKIDYYQDNGCFEPEQEVEVKEISTEKAIQLLYQSISKANKRLEKPDCRNAEKTIKLRDKQLQRLMELKSKA